MRSLAEWWQEKRRELTTTAISLGMHLLVLGALSLVVFQSERIQEVLTTIVTQDEPEPPPEAISEASLEQPDSISGTVDNDSALNETLTQVMSDQIQPIEMDVSDSDPTQLLAEEGPGLDLKAAPEIAGRSARGKAALVKQLGGNSDSEASVISGLRWLKSRQMKDGGWDFNHVGCEDCRGKDCSQPGDFKEYRTAATGLALMAFLGGGHTHEKGDYRSSVRIGLRQLLKMGKNTPAGLDLRGATPAMGHHDAGLYSHAIATIALCETLALTKDRKYREPAQGAARFIMAAQDPRGGGWRYELQQPGDTSVVGWQVMALKSAKNAGIEVPGISESMQKAEQFLTSIQSDSGAMYGYDSPAPTPTCTAIGLLCRMYMGWDRDQAPLQRGIAFLDQTRPSTNNMYYNYYATQVMLHWGGDEWNRWNAAMRDHLVLTQLKEGPEAGSWNVADPHGGAGGRLYMTALSIMTLEVYYRHLPMYQRDKIKVEF